MKTNLIKKLSQILATAGVVTTLGFSATACNDNSELREILISALESDTNLTINKYGDLEFFSDGYINILVFKTGYQANPIKKTTTYYNVALKMPMTRTRIVGYEIDDTHIIRYNVSSEDFELCTANIKTGISFSKLPTENLESLQLVVENYDPYSVVVNGEETVYENSIN